MCQPTVPDQARVPVKDEAALPDAGEKSFSCRTPIRGKRTACDGNVSGAADSAGSLLLVGPINPASRLGAAEKGVIILIYLDLALAALGRALTRADLRTAILQGAVEDVRSKIMTVVAIMAGLVPILRSTGSGSEAMRRVAAPMVGAWCLRPC